MKGHVWVAVKPGEERKFSSTTGYSPEFADSLKAQGFLIIHVSYDLPPEFDTADVAVSGKVDRRR